MSTAVLVITTPNGTASEALPKDPTYAAQVIADLAVFIPKGTWEVRVHDGPVCQDCGEPTHYQRGTNSKGAGLSTWVHTVTRQSTCADGRGYPRRPAGYDREESA